MNQPCVPETESPSKNPTLSVCMIVRDEEKNLARGLKSVQAVAHELIVVDTGSKDKTISIAKDFGAKVFHFEWCNDFSAARNTALEKATGDWILQLDADEALVESGVPTLKERIRQPSLLAIAIMCDSGPEYPGPRYCWVLRLFRNHPGLRYHRPYHEGVEESVNCVINAESRWQMIREEKVTLRHYGYDPSGLQKKRQRGVAIMKSYVVDHPQDWHTLTMLGSACGGLGLYDEAELYLRMALNVNSDYPVANYSLGLALAQQDKSDEAMEYLKKILSDDLLKAEVHTCIGSIYIQKGLLDRAVAELKKALSINPELLSAQHLLAEAKRRYKTTP